jgi:hypothetical protein
MATTTERQQAADALHRAFLVNLIAETEAQLIQLNSQGADSGHMDLDSESDLSS